MNFSLLAFRLPDEPKIVNFTVSSFHHFSVHFYRLGELKSKDKHDNYSEYVRRRACSLVPNCHVHDIALSSIVSVKASTSSLSLYVDRVIAS